VGGGEMLGGVGGLVEVVVLVGVVGLHRLVFKVEVGGHRWRGAWTGCGVKVGRYPGRLEHWWVERGTLGEWYEGSVLCRGCWEG